MNSYIHSNDMVIVLSKKLVPLHIKDVVLFMHDKKMLIKRISEIRQEKYFMAGDDPSQSTDSRQFGLISRGQIVGKVVKVIHTGQC